MCPVLAFTPEVELALRRFEDTHALVNADGRFWWQPLSAPDGTAHNRDVEAMRFLRKVHNDMVRPAAKPSTTE